jgi:hypothetical protein
MTNSISRRAINTLVYAAFMALTACGGGGSQVADGGISGTGISVGPITGFGSIISNGIEFNTFNADISFNGEQATSTQLKVGMLVTVDGSFDTATAAGDANAVNFEYSLLGRIDELGTALESNGQILVVDEQTSYGDTTTFPLKSGDHIVASGFIRPNGELLATYIERQVPSPGSFVIVDGIVEDIDAGARTFAIRNTQRDANGLEKQIVDFSGAVLTGFGASGLQNDSRVHIEGTLPDNTIIATRIRNKGNDVSGIAGTGFLLQSIMESGIDQGRFRASGNDIYTDMDTIVDNGDLSDLKVNDRLRITGSIDSENHLVAGRITIINAPTTLIQAPAEAVNLADNTVTVLGLKILVNDLTVLVDQSSQHITSFSLRNIAIGDRLLVNLFQDNGSAIATKLIRVDANGNTGVSVEGPSDAGIADPVFSITGISVNTINLPDNTGFSLGGLTPLTRTDYFRTLREGMNVRMTGQLSGSTLIPDTVTLLSCCNFTMTDPAGSVFGGANDVIFTWDGTLYTDPLTQTTPNISLTSATPTPFFGFPWTVHDARAFGPGSYSFDTGNGTPLNLEVGPGQIGAHLLFDWNIFPDIDMVLLWNRNTTVDGEIYDSPAGQVFGLASADGNGDGIPGIPMVDGPFLGFTPNFNIRSVPIPAAVWLLGSVMIGIVALGRRGSRTSRVL